MQVTIEKMDHLGKGIGYVNGKICFVPYTVPNDVVNVKITKENSKYLTGQAIEVIKPGKQRVDSFCPYFTKCGGCQLQYLNYLDTINYKKERIANLFHKIGINKEIEFISNENAKNYRNKIELKIKDGKLGFYQNKSHEIIEIDFCPITKQAINNFLPEIKKFNIQNGDITLRCNYNDELLISIKTNDTVNLKDDYSHFKVVGIVINDKCLYGDDHFLEKINNYFFEVSYDSFFQVNSYINSKLFELIQENVQGNNVLDLYSGVGTLGIVASLTAKKVYAIEIIENAVINAIKNARINNANNINFILGDTQDKLKYINDEIDTVIVDPPRKGIDKDSINYLLKLKPEKIIYISCETQTLINNLKDLSVDYEVYKIYALDMFSYTYHVECVILLQRKD